MKYLALVVIALAAELWKVHNCSNRWVRLAQADFILNIAHSGSQIACVGFPFGFAKLTRLKTKAHKSPHVRWFGFCSSFEMLTVKLALISTVTSCKARFCRAFHTFKVSLLTVTSLVFYCHYCHGHYFICLSTLLVIYIFSFAILILLSMLY